VKRKVIRSSLLLLVLFSPFVIWRLWLWYNLNNQLAAIRADGLPTNAKELDRWYPAVPANQNAALVLTQAISGCDLKSGGKTIWDFKLPARGKKLSSAQADLLRRQIELDTTALAKADEAIRLSASRYPIDFSMGFNTALPHLAYLKRFAVLHQVKAALDIEAGEFANASTNIDSMLGLARTLDSEPCLISQLVRLMIIRIAVTTLERRIGSGPIDGLEVTNLVAAFEQTPEATSQLVKALIGERAMVASLFSMNKEDAVRMLELAKNKEEEQNFPRHRALPLRVAGFYDLDEGFFLYAMGRGIELVEGSWNMRAANYLMKAGEKAQERYYLASSQTLSAYGASIPRQIEGDALTRLAITALAVEQFRNQKGHLPETLEMLEPEFLADIREDPFDGEPLRYRRLAKGYVLYSVGGDREDNHGKEMPEPKASPIKKGYDVTFTVER